jgi:folylpolyglutamate synthase
MTCGNFALWGGIWKERKDISIYRARFSVLFSTSIGLSGVHQRYNSLLAVELCKEWLTRCKGVQFDEPQGQVPVSFYKGLKEVKWPGRGQILPVQHTKYASEVRPDTDLTWYLDGAHTAESLQVRFLMSRFR